MIQVYFMDITPLKNQTLFEKAMGYIDAERKEKVLLLKGEKNKLLSLGAGLLLTYAFIQSRKALLNNGYSEKKLSVESILHQLELEYGFRGEDMKVMKAPNGKPYLADHKELFFNLSHSGDFVLLALSNEEVGADIQIHRPVVKGLSRRILHENEKAETDEELISLWTVKEACTKCSGDGIFKDFKTLFVNLRENKVTDTTNGSCYRIKPINIDNQYEAYVCNEYVDDVIQN